MKNRKQIELLNVISYRLIENIKYVYELTNELKKIDDAGLNTGIERYLKRLDCSNLLLKKALLNLEIEFLKESK